MKKIAFTPVLNGMSFLKKQYNFIPNMFDHWYIIEGVLNNKNDGCHNGNVVVDQFVDKNFLSIDGTTEYLDSIKCNNISIIRKNKPWDGYVEMANAIMNNVEDCILFYIDVDEFWDKDTVLDVSKFLEKSSVNTLKFMCYYFVGKDRYVFEQNKFGNNWFEWMRAWRIDQKMNFKTLQPPELYNNNDIKFLEKNETFARGWAFTHYAYALEEQIIFKEKFHNHANLLNNWKNLQKVPKGTDCLLSDYIPFRNADTKLYYLK
jgi:hypothetical protein